jgi:hypothetical protein
MVAAPEGMGIDIARVAFSVEIETVSHRQVVNRRIGGETETKDVVDMETSTPKAKRFIDALLLAPFYKQEDFTISIRQPRAIISGQSVEELTKPLAAPSLDIFEEKWQFSQITYSFVGRVFIAGGLLAYGLIRQQILLIVAGLLFLQLLPTLLAVAFGTLAKEWKLVGRGFAAFFTAIVLLILSGAGVAALSDPPVRFDDFSSLPVSFLISLAVGIAAGLAVMDDAGRRELIGLGAAAQTAIIPVWFGICLVFGFPKTTGQTEISMRILTFFVNFLTLIAASLIVYWLIGAAKSSLIQKK